MTRQVLLLPARCCVLGCMLAAALLCLLLCPTNKAQMMHCLLGVSPSAQGFLWYSGRNADGSCQTLQVCDPGLASCQQVCGRVDLLVS